MHRVSSLVLALVINAFAHTAAQSPLDSLSGTPAGARAKTGLPMVVVRPDTQWAIRADSTIGDFRRCYDAWKSRGLPNACETLQQRCVSEGTTGRDYACAGNLGMLAHPERHLRWDLSVLDQRLHLDPARDVRVSGQSVAWRVGYMIAQSHRIEGEIDDARLQSSTTPLATQPYTRLARFTARWVREFFGHYGDPGQAGLNLLPSLRIGAGAAATLDSANWRWGGTALIGLHSSVLSWRSGSIGIDAEGTLDRSPRGPATNARDRALRFGVSYAPGLTGDDHVLDLAYQRDRYYYTTVKHDTVTVTDTLVVVKTSPSVVSFDFAYDSPELDDRASSALSVLVGPLTQSPLSRVVIFGNADACGPSAHNDSLSANRAQAARDFLTRKNIESWRIDIVPVGARWPNFAANAGAPRPTTMKCESLKTAKGDPNGLGYRPDRRDLTVMIVPPQAK